MESLSIMGVIYRVANEIAKAASGARQCKRRCQELARRVEVIAEIVRESEAAPNDSATRTTVLDRLRDSLEELLEVVQSCRSFTKLLLAGRSTSSRIDNAERKINNCLLELGVANDVRLGLGNQKNTTAAGHLAVHDGLVPRTSTVMNNSGIVTNTNAMLSYNSAKQKSMSTYNISAGGSVHTYFGDSSSRNEIKEDSVAATQNNSWRVSVPAAGGSSVSVRDEDFNRNARTKEDAITMPTRAGNRRYDRNGQATAGQGIQKAAAAAAGPQMLSTTRPRPVCFKASQARSEPGKDLHPRPPESNAGWSTESQASLPVFEGNSWPWTPPPHGPQPQDYQYPYGAADEHGDVPYYYNHHSVEEDPSSCSIM